MLASRLTHFAENLVLEVAHPLVIAMFRRGSRGDAVT
jgi:hypothetical protein